MLTVRDIAALPALELEVRAGAAGLDNAIRWVHVSELVDPTPWLEGGELLITTGLGVGELTRPQAEYVRRLAEHGLAGLAFGVGFGWAEPPEALVREAERLDFPVVTVPYEVPFIALTKAISAQLANEQLSRVERALTIHERLAEAVLEGRGVPAILGDHIGCSLALVDEGGRIVGERHGDRLAGCEEVLELPVVADGAIAILRAASNGACSRSTTGSPFTTARRRSPSSTRDATRSRPPSSGLRVTCSRTSSTTGSTSARSPAGSRPSGSIHSGPRRPARNRIRRRARPRGRRRRARGSEYPLALRLAARPSRLPRRHRERDRRARDRAGAR